MLSSFSRLLVGCTLSASLFAQAPCSDLAVTGDGSPGTSLTFAVSGAPANVATILMISPEQGRTKVSFGQLGGFSLGLAHPFIPMMMGNTDAMGAVETSLPIPAGFPLSLMLYAQAVSVDAMVAAPPDRGSDPGPRLMLRFCVSDLESFNIGALTR